MHVKLATFKKYCARQTKHYQVGRFCLWGTSLQPTNRTYANVYLGSINPKIEESFVLSLNASNYSQSCQ